jgi:hypothetical protein
MDRSLVFVYRLLEWFPYVFRVTVFARARRGTADFYDVRRTLILLMCNYVEMTFWFATMYLILARNKSLTVENGPQGIIVLRESIMSMVANSSNSFTHLSGRAWLVLCFQNALGLFLTVVVAARLINSLPTPTSSKDTQGQKRSGARGR